MKATTSWKRRAWFWVGVTLLSISALFWLILVLATEPEVDMGENVLGGVIITAIPIGIGIYGVMHGRKAPAVETQQSPDSTYASRPAMKSTQEVELRPEHPYASQPTVKPVQPYRGLFGWLKERLRDKTRDKLCSELCAIGLDARMAERGRLEEHIGKDWWGKSKGLIEIQDCPIRWVNVLKRSGGSDNSDYYTNVYLVSVASVRAEGYSELESVRVRSVPLFGEVVDLRWKAKYFKGDLIMRLNDDQSLKESLVRLKEDVAIRFFPKHQCCAIASSNYLSSWLRADRQPVQSRELWDCYETIARHLLESSEK